MENLRKKFSGLVCFRIVSAVSALFSQYNRFLDCEKMRKGRNWTKMDEIWLAARVCVGLAARALVLCHTGPTNERVERQARGLNFPERGGGRRS